MDNTISALDAGQAADADGHVHVHVVKRQSGAVQSLLQRLAGKEKQEQSNLLAEHPAGSPEDLGAALELSALLRPNIDAYVTNIETQGHHFEPAVDLNASDADERVRDALYVTALLEAKAADQALDTILIPDDSIIEAKITSLRRSARIELARARSFFVSCNPDGTFEDLRKAMRQDLETTGNAWWEVLRGQNGMPRTLHHLPAVQMRISVDYADVLVTDRHRITDLTWEVFRVRRRFYKFAQVCTDGGLTPTWYKEFGDPRTISRTTGAVFEDVLDLKSVEGVDAEPATEAFHFALYSCVSQYGLPRWIGNLPNVLGSRELDETNYDYFLSNAIPALAILIAGGRFAKGVEEKLKEFFEEETRGQRATHKLIILEAERQRQSVQGPTVNPRIEFVPLRNAQVQDGLFQRYDERNFQKVSMSFRLPASLTAGKATLADLRMAEDQVFGPERQWFDARINKFFMPALGIQFWEFKSNSLMTRDPEVLGKLALAYGKEGFLLPAEVRKLAERVFNTNLPQIKTHWATQPMPFTLAIFGMKAGPAEAVREQGRQAGDPAPIDQILSELGLDPEEAAITPIGRDGAVNAHNDRQAILPGGQALDPLSALNAAGFGVSPPGEEDLDLDE